MKLHIDPDNRHGVPRRLEAGGKGVVQRAAFKKEFSRGIDEIADIGGVLVFDHQDQLRHVGQTQFVRYVNHIVSDKTLDYRLRPV